MPRYKLTIEYDGGGFVGWQRQENGLSVQQVLEGAIEKFCGEATTLFGAGRTDTGVHALGQVAHFDLAEAAEADTVRDALNFHVRPAAISILAAELVDDDFHARFSATERAYLYRIINRRPQLTLDKGRAWHVIVPLDSEAMAEAAKTLVGFHDFTSFRSVYCQAESAEKTMNHIAVTHRDGEIRLLLRAPSFLHNQVRIIAGTLAWVGEGKWTPGDVAQALAARDRTAAGPTAPPEGLYFLEAVYGKKRGGKEKKKSRTPQTFGRT